MVTPSALTGEGTMMSSTALLAKARYAAHGKS